MTLTKKPESPPAPASWGLAKRGAPWEYAAAPESTDHIQIRREYGLFIDNAFAPSRPKATFEVINPATEEPLAEVHVIVMVHHLVARQRLVVIAMRERKHRFARLFRRIRADGAR